MNVNFELLQLYIRKNLIKQGDADAILRECESSGLSLRDHLLAKGIVDERGELIVLAEYYGMAYCDMDMLEIDRELVGLYSYGLMKKHRFVPVSYGEEGVLKVAVAKPLDCHSRSVLASQIVGRYECVLVLPSQIDRYIDSIAAADSTFSALNDLNSEKKEQLLSLHRGNSGVIREDSVINNPAVRFVDSIIKEAIPYRASDIHIEPFEKSVHVRYRIDGDLKDHVEIPIESYPSVCARLKIMSGIDIAERRVPQDGRINMAVGDTEYDLRVSTLPTVFGEKFVIRVLDKSSFGFVRADLGFSEKENLIVDKMLSRPHGIVLLTGPTGCGKSTTLYSFLKEINDSKVNIVTVEDPVEYTMPRINQTQVNVKANLTFATALRSILRQDPDVIMIGEIRDEETAEIAVRSAITGHLVFSTLHTNDAPGAVIRLLDMGVKDYLIADALVGVIAQRLVKKLCPVCKQRVVTDAKEMEILGLSEPAEIYRPQGCQFCNNTGYKGRTAVHEMMYMNDAVKNAVAREKNQENLRRICIENGMTTLQESCKALVVGGITDMRELMRLIIE